VLAGGLLAALSEVNEPSGAGPCAGGLANRAKAFFVAHGFTGIVRIATDNGAWYRAHDFARVLHDARHQRITPCTPRHNGKVACRSRSRHGWWFRRGLSSCASLRRE
jgi:hypothetical protein